MAQQLANDPSFQQQMLQVQQSFGVAAEGAKEAEGAGDKSETTKEGEEGEGELLSDPRQVPPPLAMDPTKAWEAMLELFSNPQFVQMAGKVGQTMLQVLSCWRVACGVASEPTVPIGGGGSVCEFWLCRYQYVERPISGAPGVGCLKCCPGMISLFGFGL